MLFALKRVSPPCSRSGVSLLLPVCAQVTDGVVDVIVYQSSAEKNRNRGFAFVEYESHKAAAMARRRLIPGKLPPPLPPHVPLLL